MRMYPAIQDLVFLIDITDHLNRLNIKLRGKEKLITDMYDTIASFVQKFSMLEKHLKTGILIYFVTYSSKRKMKIEFYHNIRMKLKRLQTNLITASKISRRNR